MKIEACRRLLQDGCARITGDSGHGAKIDPQKLTSSLKVGDPMLLATTFTLCPLLAAAPDGVGTLGQSSRETTNFVPHPADSHLMTHSTQHLG